MSGDFFDRVEVELTAAARRRAGDRWSRLRNRRFGGPLVLAGAVAVAGAAALAATGQLELGSPDRPVHHSLEAAGRGIGVPQSSTARVLAVRTPDPVGGPPWGIRVFRSSRGYPCAQYGRVVGGRLVRLGSDGTAHELALHCLGHAAPGGFGNTVVEASGAFEPARRDPRALYYGYVGTRARRVVFESRTAPRRLVLPVRDGAYLAVYEHTRRQRPRITVVLDDGTRLVQSPSAPPIPGTAAPRRPVPPRIRPRAIATSARTIGPDGSALLTFTAPLPIHDLRLFYRAEANGPHAAGCSGRVLAGTQRNYDRGDVVRLRLRRPTREPWCRGTFRGRVSIGLRRTVGRFRLTVR